MYIKVTAPHLLAPTPEQLFAANRLEAVIARIARREGDPHERRERARRIRSDILLARRIRGGPAPALPQAWGGSVD